MLTTAERMAAAAAARVCSNGASEADTLTRAFRSDLYQRSCLANLATESGFRYRHVTVRVFDHVGWWEQS